MTLLNFFRLNFRLDDKFEMLDVGYVRWGQRSTVGEPLVACCFLCTVSLMFASWSDVLRMRAKGHEQVFQSLT